MSGKLRIAGLAAGTVLIVAGAAVVWSLAGGHPQESGALPVASPETAEAGVTITPGPSTRRPARPAVLASNDQARPVAGAKAAADDESWQILVLDNLRIGWSRTAQREVTVNRQKVLQTLSEVQMKFLRFGQEVEVQTKTITEETLDGDLLSYTLEIKNPPAATTVTTGKVDGKNLIVETNVSGRAQTSNLEWDPTVKSPTWEDRAMKANPIAPGDKRTFRTFVPEFNKVSTVHVTADDYQSVKLFDGSSQRLLRTRTTQSLLPDRTTRSWVDDKGRTLRSEVDLLGKAMVTYRVTREEALKAIPSAEVDIAATTLVPVGVIRDPYKTTRGVYRIKLPGEDPAKHLVSGPGQKIQRVSDDTVDVTVTPVVLPRDLKTVAVADEYVRPTQFLQSNDPAVVEHARRAVPVSVEPQRAAVQMAEYVRTTITKKNFSTALASAAEVAKSREGDCTEHAVLLAAMLRNRGIPSRLAVGLVYVEASQSFSGHMWTEAWLGGTWYPLDATLGRGGIDGVHITMSTSSFADDAPAPVLTFFPLLQMLGKVKITLIETKP